MTFNYHIDPAGIVHFNTGSTLKPGDTLTIRSGAITVSDDDGHVVVADVSDFDHEVVQWEVFNWERPDGSMEHQCIMAAPHADDQMHTCGCGRNFVSNHYSFGVPPNPNFHYTLVLPGGDRGRDADYRAVYKGDNPFAPELTLNKTIFSEIGEFGDIL